MKISGIYLIENQKTKKAYVGKSIDIITRWQQHIDAARLHKYDYEFYSDLEKVEDFSFSILEQCSEELLQEKEQFYIEKLNTKQFGYNQVLAIDKSKIEAQMLDSKVCLAIELLENTNLFYKDIALKTGLTEVTISNINRCKSYTSYHSYKNNIREECGRKKFCGKGENNPKSKLTEEQVVQIINLLKFTTLSEKQIGEQFNVSKSAIANINSRKNWKHLSTEFNNNIRREYLKNY